MAHGIIYVAMHGVILFHARVYAIFAVVSTTILIRVLILTSIGGTVERRLLTA